jgi:hypothetical protein
MSNETRTQEEIEETEKYWRERVRKDNAHRWGRMKVHRDVERRKARREKAKAEAEDAELENYNANR